MEIIFLFFVFIFFYFAFQDSSRSSGMKFSKHINLSTKGSRFISSDAVKTVDFIKFKYSLNGDITVIGFNPEIRKLAIDEMDSYLQLMKKNSRDADTPHIIATIESINNRISLDQLLCDSELLGLYNVVEKSIKDNCNIPVAFVKFGEPIKYDRLFSLNNPEIPPLKIPNVFNVAEASLIYQWVSICDSLTNIAHNIRSKKGEDVSRGLVLYLSPTLYSLHKRLNGVKIEYRVAKVIAGAYARFHGNCEPVLFDSDNIVSAELMLREKWSNFYCICEDNYYESLLSDNKKIVLSEARTEHMHETLPNDVAIPYTNGKWNASSTHWGQSNNISDKVLPFTTTSFSRYKALFDLDIQITSSNTKVKLPFDPMSVDV